MNTIYVKRLRDLREDHDKTQQDIANILGTSQTMYARYERGTMTGVFCMDNASKFSYSAFSFSKTSIKFSIKLATLKPHLSLCLQIGFFFILL